MSNLIDDALANPIVGATGTALAGAAVALWIAAAWWAWRDAGRRTETAVLAYAAAAWVLLSTPLLLPLALAIYAVVRPPATAAEHRAQSLIAALSRDAAADPACPSCLATIDPAWLRCPRCATWVAAPCSSCGEWSPAELDLCPFCGREGHGVPAVDDRVPALDVVSGPAPAGTANPRPDRGVVARLRVPFPRRIGA